MTSVIGHVLSIDFPPAYQSWEKTDPASLFTAPTIKSEANPKVNQRPPHLTYNALLFSSARLCNVKLQSWFSLVSWQLDVTIRFANDKTERGDTRAAVSH